MSCKKVNSIAFILIAFLYTHGVFAQDCSYKLKVSFKSGETACLSDFPFSKKISQKWNKPIADVVTRNGNYLIAGSEKCDLYEVFVAPNFGDTARNFPPVIADAEGYARQCPKECACSILVKDGAVTVDRYTAMGQGGNQDIASATQSPRKREQDEVLGQISSELNKLREENSVIQRERLELERMRMAQATTQNSNSHARMAPSPNRRALVIGNDNYQGIPKLANAREDAKTIATELSNVGYNVTLKFDLGEKGLKSTLRAFRNQIEPGDEVAFFYAGHGVQLDNTNYLLPIDIAGENEEQIRDEAIPLQRILDDASSKKAKFTLAMIDACRDNPFKTMGRSIGGTRGLAPTSAATGQMVIFSAGAGQQALDKLGPNDKSKNGLFTRVFAKQIQTPGVTVDRLLRNVRVDVVNMAKSVGHEQTPAIYDQAVGDFYFKK